MEEIYKDSYYAHFGAGRYTDLLAAQKHLEDNTQWENDILTKDMEFSSICFAPNMDYTVLTAMPEYSGITPELLKDTDINAGLVTHYNGKNLCLRSCAMQSLMNTIGISGAAIGRSMKTDLAVGMNAFVKSARNKSKVMIRAGKVSAVLSQHYQYMPISELLEVCKELEQSFGSADFVSGSICHSLTTAQYEFPESAAKITAAYNSALLDAGKPRNGTLIPVVQLRAADTCDEAAKLVTYLKFGPDKLMPIGGFSVKHLNPRSLTKDSKRITCMEKFRQEASVLFSKMEYDIRTLIPKMLEVKINYPGNSFVGLCKYAGIPQKWGGLIEEDVRADYPNGSDCTFLDLYEAMTGVTALAIRDGFKPSSQRVLELEEGITKVARMRESWKKYDLPGTVAWSQTASSQE